MEEDGIFTISFIFCKGVSTLTKWAKTPKNAYLAVSDPISVILGTNSIPYPIWNVARNTMVAFSNIKNDVIWRYDVIMTSKMAIFHPFWKKFMHLRYFHPVSVTFGPNFIPYPPENVTRKTMMAFSNFKNDVIWRYDVIMTSKMGVQIPKIAVLSIFTHMRTV